MILPNKTVDLLRRYAGHRMSTNVHPEDTNIYSQGLEDGCALMAELILGYLQEDPKIELTETTEETNA